MLKRIAKIFHRDPDFYVGGKQNPYLMRWYIIPRNRFFNIYLHKFLRDDDDRALHDHPWNSLSFSSANYMEIVGNPSNWNDRKLMNRRRLRPVWRPATYTHRVILYKNHERKPIPFYTLFITGKKVRDWGFHCPKGWRPWQDFCDERDAGQVGKGCSD